MKRLQQFLILSIVAVFPTLVSAQYMGGIAFWIAFKDKPKASNVIHPGDVALSKKALDRRSYFGIPLDARDLPVDSSYVATVLKAGDVQLAHTSRWLNGITIYSTDSMALVAIAQMPFVKEIIITKSNLSGKTTVSKSSQETYVKLEDVPYTEKYYGQSYRQISNLNLHYLHEKGYTGKGITIAVMDAGFTNVDEISAFASLRERGGILGVKDFVNIWNDSVYQHSSHGTYVLSTMAAVVPNSIIGTAPDAEYWLLRTEEGATEFIIEEDNWVAGIEFADSVGADIVNSSLGYTQFDDSKMNHTYADMNGKVSRASLAASIAAEKGMLVVNSAGNSGNSQWKYIGAPADAENILSVGAIFPDSSQVGFSSYGPTADGRIKPNTSATGAKAIGVAPNDTLYEIYGTSFSSPITAGAAACLWQAKPWVSNLTLIKTIEENSHLFAQPNDQLGYGICNYAQAFQSLTGIPIIENEEEGSFSFTSNPISNRLVISSTFPNTVNATFKIVDVTGKQIINAKQTIYYGINDLRVEVKNMASGIYILEIKADGISNPFSKKFVKVDAN